MTYRNQPYYKDFRDLLNRLRRGLSFLKNENHQLTLENESLSRELFEVRSQVAEAQREIDELKGIVAGHQSEGNEPDTRSHLIARGYNGDPSADDQLEKSKDNPAMFDNLNGNEKIALRQQITELIGIIDRHLNGKE